MNDNSVPRSPSPVVTRSPRIGTWALPTTPRTHQVSVKEEDAVVHGDTPPPRVQTGKTRFEQPRQRPPLAVLSTSITRAFRANPIPTATDSAGSQYSDLEANSTFGRWDRSDGSVRYPSSVRGDWRRPRPQDEGIGPVSLVVVDNDLLTQPGFIFDPEAERQREAKERERDVEIERAMADAELESGYNSHMSDASSSPARHGSLWKRRFRQASKATWKLCRTYVEMPFADKQAEATFQKERWHSSKAAALCAALFLLIQYIISCALQTKAPRQNVITYIGGGGVAMVPPVFLVALDGQQRFKWLYQIWIAAGVWTWGFAMTHDLHVSNYFAPNQMCRFSFLTLLFSMVSYPTMSIVALCQSRIVHLSMAVGWTILSIIWFTKPHTPTTWWRNTSVVLMYHILLTLHSYFRERSDRQFFLLRTQLKTQYRAVQSAQAQERRAEQSKRRFVSYIFHEVRVPLNTARLAVTNLDGEGAFAKMTEDQQDMIMGLDGSLSMMEKVLNDVLSFNRMESGNLVLARKPFDFHKAIHYVAMSHRALADMSGLDFELELDPRIDQLGSTVIGDEMRFKQVCSNLVSNAFKFTTIGGVRIVTKLLYPTSGNSHFLDKSEAETPTTARTPSTLVGSDIEKEELKKNPPSPPPPVSPTLIPPSPHVTYCPNSQFSKAVIRVEVHDTGCGISPRDVTDNRLFSPYVQTEIGRRQGGKGSGLGLALVMQIVKLSHGRLGVDSEHGKGSVFWFELPYTLPPPETQRTKLQLPGILTQQANESKADLSILSDGSTTSPWTRRVGGHNGMNRRNRSLGGEADLCRPNDLQLSEPPPVQGAAPPQSILPPPTESRLPYAASLFGPMYPDLPMTKAPSWDRVQSSNKPSFEVPSRASPDLATTSEPAPIPTDDKIPPPAPLGSMDAGGSTLSVLETMLPADPTPNLPPPRDLPAAPLLDIAPPPPATPLAVEQPPPATPPSPTPPSPPPLNVFVVDDDTLTRKLMARMLTRLELEWGRPELEVDVVFLDNQMPLMTGVEVAREVRRLGITVYIVGCTGNALREDQDEYLGAGADGILPKPVAQRDVIQKLGEARKRKETRTEAAVL